MPSGSKCFAAFSSTTKANDDWLISPELPGMEQTISFWNRSTNVNYGYDQFEVLYSTTGNTPADFVKLGDTYSANLGWSKVEVQLPEGSKYFAIRCISYQTEAWLIDDISYTRGTPSYTVIGYNIYRDCIKINDAVVTDNKYVDNLTKALTSETDNHSYNVTAVYAEGESVFQIHTRPHRLALTTRTPTAYRLKRPKALSLSKERATWLYMV